MSPTRAEWHVKVIDGMTRAWRPRVGSEAASTFAQVVWLMVASPAYLGVGSVLWAVGGYLHNWWAFGVGTVCQVVFAVYLVRLFVGLSRFNKQASAALGVRVRWGLPVAEKNYRKWCADHGVEPNPFADQAGRA